MKKLTLALASILTLTLSAGAFADQKIGVVNMRQVVQSSPEFTKVKNDLDKKFTPEQKKIAKAQESLQKAVENFRRNASVMKAADKKKEEQKIVKQQQILQKMQLTFQKDYMEERNKTVGDLMKKLNEVIAKIAKKGNFDLVLPTEAVVFSNDKLDITKQVEKALKK